MGNFAVNVDTDITTRHFLVESVYQTFPFHVISDI